MPLCAEHGQVFGEGSRCIVCAGGTIHHEAENVPQLLSTKERNAYEEALELLNDKCEGLSARLEVLEALAVKE